MSRFSVGDKVRVNCPGSAWHGDETTVTSALRLSSECLEVSGKISRGIWVHSVAIEPDTRFNCVVFEPHELIPLYDGRELVSWESCAWRPTSVRV